LSLIEVADNDWQSKQAEIDKRNAEAKGKRIARSNFI